MSSDLRDAVLQVVNDPHYRPVKPAVIARKLGLAREAGRDLKKTIKRLVKEKQLAYGPQHLVCAAGNRPQGRNKNQLSGFGVSLHTLRGQASNSACQSLRNHF